MNQDTDNLPDLEIDQSLSPKSLNPFTPDNLFTLTGRLNRMDFAIFLLSIYLLMYLLFNNLGINQVVVSIKSIIDPENIGSEFTTMQRIGLLSQVILALVSVRRFHDLNYKGWYALLLFIPLIGFILILILLFAPGNPQKNQFGEKPIVNHRNKVLILISLLVVNFMMINSIAQEAMPYLPELQEYLESM